MIRRTLTILSLIGLLLSAGLWGVSYLRVWIFLGGSCSLGARKGMMFVSRTPSPVGPFTIKEEMMLSGYSHVMSIGGVLHVGAEGFQSFATAWWMPSGSFLVQRWSGRGVVVPLWMPTVLFGALFASSRPLRSRRRRKRKKLGLCLKCGYDLRASKERCPECGEEFGSTGVEG